MKKTTKKRPGKVEAALGTRRHLDSPPRGTAVDQTRGFHEVLMRLYRIEDQAAPVGGADIGVLFAEARAICERFLPVPLSTTLRNKHK